MSFQEKEDNAFQRQMVCNNNNNSQSDAYYIPVVVPYYKCIFLRKVMDYIKYGCDKGVSK